MTNEEIIKQLYNTQMTYDEALELARADERSKLAGLYFSKEAVEGMIAEERRKLQVEIGHLGYKIEGLQQLVSKRKDERVKLSKEGVKVWVSWDSDDVPYISKIQPERQDINGTILYLFSGIHYDKLPYWLIDSMNLQRGECKAFEIWECVNG